METWSQTGQMLPTTTRLCFSFTNISDCTYVESVQLQVGATMQRRKTEQRVLQVQQSTIVSVDDNITGVNVDYQ